MYEQINTHQHLHQHWQQTYLLMSEWCVSAGRERERKDKFTLEQNVTNDHINVNT